MTRWRQTIRLIERCQSNEKRDLTRDFGYLPTLKIDFFFIQTGFIKLIVLLALDRLQSQTILRCRLAQVYVDVKSPLTLTALFLIYLVDSRSLCYFPAIEY